MKKKIKKNLFGFILGAILISLTTVYAANTIHSKNFTVDTSRIDSLSGSVTVQDAIEDLYKKNCPSKYKCYKLKSTPEVGDYIKMTPTSKSFTTDTAKTGYTSTQTINPSELNVWRVIKVNSDGTIDVVSENISSTEVYFGGQTGYKNLVGYLNVLASQYTNTKYVQSTRHMGYNGQTQYLTDTANTVDSTVATAPWTCSTGGSCSPVESKGGGDTLYTNDTNLVKNALGTLVANNPSGIPCYYWLASRYYSGSTYWSYNGRAVHTGDGISIYGLYYYLSGLYTSSSRNSLRPILTLKSGISYTPALGTSDDPFVLS